MKYDELVKGILKIPNNHELRSGGGVACITTGAITCSYSELNAAGETVASYRVVRTNDGDGSGSITWTKTERNAS